MNSAAASDLSHSDVLARICADRIPTFHIADASCLVSGDTIRHRPVGGPSTAKVLSMVSSHQLLRPTTGKSCGEFTSNWPPRSR